MINMQVRHKEVDKVPTHHWIRPVHKIAPWVGHLPVGDEDSINDGEDGK